MKRILATAVLMIGAFIALPASPAAAGECTWIFCGNIIHLNDEGYDAPFKVRCNFGDPSSERWVYEGKSSPCKDTDQIYVASGKQIACLNDVGAFYVKFDATGWHKITDLETYACVHQLD